MPKRLRKVRATRSHSRLGEQASEATIEQFARIPVRAQLTMGHLPGLLLVILGLLMLRHMLTAERFMVSAVEITGTRLLAPDDIRANVGLMDQNIFAVNGGAIERMLLDRYACLNDVQVSCRLPNTCRIRVAEVDQVVIWEQGGEAWLVALDGLVLGPATTTTDAPRLVNSAAYIAPQDGYLVGVPWRYAFEASQVLAEGQPLEFIAGYGLMVRVGDGKLPVYLGTEGDIATKLKIAADVLAEAERRGLQITYIDLRSASRPVVGGL